ncbi:EamA family transporter [Ihubacter sp. rT4E-8]|uniref:EamA family transporter n=1 Tax=unclassified Ihubacter TaxID=2633299 RepID=UPI003C7B9D4E
MWLFMACIAAVLIGVSTILSKIGIKDADPYATGAVTNTVLLIAFAGTAAFTGVFGQIPEMGMWTWVSIGASGVILSISWVFYFLGLAGGSVSVFLAIQSLTIVVSMALCAIFIKEKITMFMILGTVMIITGTLLMMDKQELSALKNKNILKSDQRWILFSALSAIFASVSYVIVKADRAPIDTNVTSMFRYIIVVSVLWMIFVCKKKGSQLRKITGKTWIFILLGAAASGAGHVLVYKSLYLGKAAVIMTIYRMGMVISIILSRFFLHEKLSKKGWLGFVLLAAGVAVFAVGR